MNSFMVNVFDESFKSKLIIDAEKYVPDYFDEVVAYVDKLIYSMSVDIVNSLNLFQQKGDTETFESIRDKISLVKDAEYFFRNVLYVLCVDGFLSKQGSHYTSLKSIQDIERDTAPEMFIDGILRFPDETYSIKLLARVYGFILSFIRGKIYPEEILFPWGDFELVETFYRKGKMYGYGSRILAYCLNEIIRYKFKRPVRVLEIGSGTGEASERVLDLCEGSIEKFYFTDVLKTFVKIGKAKLGSRKGIVHYKKFDITKEPERQKLGENNFDVIFAVNVIHATDDVLKSLQHIYKLLRDDGVFFLTEMTAVDGDIQRFLEFVWGILPSYHAYKDTNFRKGSPILPIERWEKAILDTGFRDVFTTPGKDTRYSDYSAVTIALK